MKATEYKEKLQKAKGKVSLLKEQLKESKVLIKEKNNYLVHLEKAQVFIQDVAKKTQERLKYHIEDVVQLAVDSIFPDEYTFSINFDIKYGKTSADLVFTKNGYPLDIMMQAGGGLVDIASLALRIATWSLSKTDNVLVLDEPIARVQPAELQAIAWDVIKELSHRLKLQFIIVSNSTNNGEAIHLVADKEFRVFKEQENIKDKTFYVSKMEVIE